MTVEGWKAAVIKAFGDLEMLRLLSELLAEQDAAKQALRDKGYGCTGMPWLQLVTEVPSCDEAWDVGSSGRLSEPRKHKNVTAIR